MRKSTIIVTGCNAAFFDFLDEALRSLLKLNLDMKADIGIMDMGLSNEQIAELKAKGYAVVPADWSLPLEQYMNAKHDVGLVGRTSLRDYFPGYSVYLWFDADAWAQTDEFFYLMVDGAQSTGAAIVREAGPGFKRNYKYNKWWYGHMIMSYGVMDGIKIAHKPAINIGVIALSDTAPHWDIWRKHYIRMSTSQHRINMDQHSYNAADTLEALPHTLLPARCNWICTLNKPVWNQETKMLHEPVKGGKPLSVVHLAGPDKRRSYNLSTLNGGILSTPITYEVTHQLQ